MSKLDVNLLRRKAKEAVLGRGITDEREREMWLLGFNAALDMVEQAGSQVAPAIEDAIMPAAEGQERGQRVVVFDLRIWTG